MCVCFVDGVLFWAQASLQWESGAQCGHLWGKPSSLPITEPSVGRRQECSQPHSSVREMQITDLLPLMMRLCPINPS